MDNIYSLFESYFGEKTQITLQRVAKRLRLNKQNVIDILLEGGYKVPTHNFSYYLTKKQLDFLAEQYYKSVKQFHKKSKTNYYNQSEEFKLSLDDFFKKFVHNGENLSISELLVSQIDKDLVLKFFYDLIESETNSNRSCSSYSFLGNIKFIISKKCNSKTLVFSTQSFNNSNYYIYPDEEDESIRLTFNQNGFSYTLKLIREALIKIEYLLKRISWKTKMYSYLESNRVIYHLNIN